MSQPQNLTMPVEFQIEHAPDEPTHCPYCQTEISAADTLVRCSDCNATYHVSCWNEGDKCAMYGCDSELAVAIDIQTNGTSPDAQADAVPQSNFAGVPDFSIDISELPSAPQVTISENELAPALSCSYCHLEVGIGESSVVCMKCHATHHHDCWLERKRCAVYGCNHRVCSVPINTAHDSMVYQPSTVTMRNPTDVNVEVKTSWYRRVYDYLVDVLLTDRHDAGRY